MAQAFVEMAQPSDINRENNIGRMLVSPPANENPFMSFMMPLVAAAMEETSTRDKKRKLEDDAPEESESSEEIQDEEAENEEGYESGHNAREEDDADYDDELYDDEENGANKRVRREERLSLKRHSADSSSSDEAKRKNGAPSTNASKKDTKKRRVKSIAQSRSIFKKAVLRVFLDQRKKGVHTLSLSQVWSLIREAGLIKTMGKTPIQSVSCALSQDVLRGSESSFVRVGKGLYALKDDISDQHLAQYLENDANWNDSPSPSSSSVSSSSVPKKNKGGRKKPRSASPSTPRSPVTVIIPAPPVPADKSARWIGESVGQNEKRTFYGAVQIDKQIYRLGACAYLEPPSEQDKPFLGRIASLFQEDDQMYVECIWYFYPEDTHGKVRDSHDQEVFLSKTRDINTIDALLSSKVDVVSYTEFKERQLKGKTEDLFFCRKFYSWDTETFETINLNDNILMLVANFDKLQAKATVNMLLTELQLCQIEIQSTLPQIQSLQSDSSPNTSHNDDSSSGENSENVDDKISPSLKRRAPEISEVQSSATTKHHASGKKSKRRM